LDRWNNLDNQAQREVILGEFFAVRVQKREGA